MQDYDKVLIISQSGCGKTYSFRKMNPETTGFINVENKPLPFKSNFKYHSRPGTLGEFQKALVEYAKTPEITCIVIDSISALFDIILQEARASKKGFDVWNDYNENLGKILLAIKKINKNFFITGHYEILGIEGAQEKRLKSKGKEWEAVIEKEFTIVLYADKHFDLEGKPNYFFRLVGENTSAKCPPDIFGEEVYQIDNDCNQILNKLIEYRS